MDHFFQMDAAQIGLKPDDPMLDGYTALSYLAAVTQQARLGTMVTGVVYRHPGHLVKAVSALDVLSGGRAYRGKYYHLAEPMNYPQPLSKPHPPILIGGAGEQKTLRLVAQYADASNLFAFAGVEALTRKLDVLKRHCQEIGRNYEDIEKTALGQVYLGPGGMSLSDLIDFCRSLADVGIQHFIFSIANVHDITPIETIGREVIPVVREF